MLYGYHIDGMVLNLLLNSDTAGSIDLNTGTYMSVAIRLALFLLPIGVMFTGAEIFRRIRILSVRTSLFLVMIVFLCLLRKRQFILMGCLSEILRFRLWEVIWDLFILCFLREKYRNQWGLHKTRFNWR